MTQTGRLSDTARVEAFSDGVFARRKCVSSPRKGSPATNTFGLLFHLAEHTQRHTGQVITTAGIVRAKSDRTEGREA